jgi:predicted NBD/HSP70 family sugar kinase
VKDIVLGIDIGGTNTVFGLVDKSGNIISQNKELLQHIPQESVFTPHEREFERLVGNFDNINDRTTLQKNFYKI